MKAQLLALASTNLAAAQATLDAINALPDEQPTVAILNGVGVAVAVNSLIIPANEAFRMAQGGRFFATVDADGFTYSGDFTANAPFTMVRRDSTDVNQITTHFLDTSENA